MSETLDWTRGGTALHYQQCPSCQHLWYFERDFCPACGHTTPNSQQALGRGVVHATTLVHRAPSDEFRAIVPYQMVLVDMAEGFRVMSMPSRAWPLATPCVAKCARSLGVLFLIF